jgi:hypothetical protein
MKTLLRSSIFALALFGSYAAIADGTKLSGVPIYAPRPSCICEPSQQLGLR